MSMKTVKEKKAKAPAEPRKKGAGRVRRERRERSSDRIQDTMRSVAFLTPSVLGVAVFFILPFLVVVYYSVIRSTMN